MKTIKIKVPDGKKAEWVDGILTLVDEPPVEFKFRAGDKVIVKSTGNKPYTITFTRVENGKVYYYFKDEEGVPYCNYSESDLEPYVEPQNITERIKTFEDAKDWCSKNGYEHLVEDWCITTPYYEEKAKDISAYLKLRIITCALNEGWEPMFERGEYRWYAWYKFLTNAELDEMTEEQIKERGICRVVGRAVSNAYAVGGLVFSNANYVSSSSVASYGSRLAFKSEELAEYAANQFSDIYMDFCFKGKE